MMPGYESALADDLEGFVAFKRMMGYKYQTAEHYLRSFDRYCQENNHLSVSKEAVEGWVVARQKNNPTPYGAWMSPVKAFGRYMRSNGDPDAYVLTDRFRMKRFRPTPYLFTEDEIGRFLDSCTSIESRRQEAVRLVTTAFFQTMYACGLRTCEARLLARSSVDLDKGVIDIRKSKGFYDRRLPISAELNAFLSDYDEKASFHHPKREAFFPSPSTGMFPSPSFVTKRFRQIWASAGLFNPAAEKQPRPYDLRHHFAFANIAKWAEEGRDVDSLIPYLMRYMGHTSLDSTYYYLHITPDFIAGYPETVGGTEVLLPEVDDYE